MSRSKRHRATVAAGDGIITCTSRHVLLMCCIQQNHPITNPTTEQKRLVTCQSDYAKLEQRSSTVTEERDQLKTYTRQLEQVNDNLERELRVVTENVTGFEAMLNEAYEKNALLEMEVDDRDKLQVMLQRLKDESRGKHSMVWADLTLRIRENVCTLPFLFAQI